MPARLRSVTIRQNPVSKEAVAAFVAEDEDTLDRLLRIPPWGWSPLQVSSDSPPPSWLKSPADDFQINEFRRVQVLRRQLEAVSLTRLI